METVWARLSIRKRNTTHTNSCPRYAEGTKYNRKKKRSISTVIVSYPHSQISSCRKPSSPSLFCFASPKHACIFSRTVLKIAVRPSSAELWIQWLCDFTSSSPSCRRSPVSFQEEPSWEEAVSLPGAGRKGSHWPRGWWHPPAEWIREGWLGPWFYVRKERNLSSVSLHFCFVVRGEKPFTVHPHHFPQCICPPHQSRFTWPCSSSLCPCAGLSRRRPGRVDRACARCVWWSVWICCVLCFCCSCWRTLTSPHGKCPARCSPTAPRSIQCKVRIFAWPWLNPERERAWARLNFDKNLMEFVTINDSFICGLVLSIWSQLCLLTSQRRSTHKLQINCNPNHF